MERIVDDGAEDLDVHGRNDSTSETIALYKAMALKFEAPFHDHGGRAEDERARAASEYIAHQTYIVPLPCQ